MRAKNPYLLLVGLLVGNAGAAESGAASQSEMINLLLDGVAANTRPFLQHGDYLLTINESRYVVEDGSQRIVPLLPKTLRFKSKGSKVYFWHDGGDFEGGTNRPVPGTYEGAFDGTRFVVLAHDIRSMTVSAQKELGSSSTQNPMEYIAPIDPRKLQAELAAHPERFSFPRREKVHGDVCFVIQIRRPPPGGDGIDRLWIDQSHGFLIRRLTKAAVPQNTSESQEHLVYEIDVSEVSEVAPGIWAPKTVREEAHYANARGFVRNVVFDKADVTTPVPDEAFTLTRPAGYLLHDRILSLHYNPDDTETDTVLDPLDDTVRTAGAAERTGPGTAPRRSRVAATPAGDAPAERTPPALPAAPDTTLPPPGFAQPWPARWLIPALGLALAASAVLAGIRLRRRGMR